MRPSVVLRWLRPRPELLAGLLGSLSYCAWSRSIAWVSYGTGVGLTMRFGPLSANHAIDFFTWFYIWGGYNNLAIHVENWGWYLEFTPAFIGSGMLVGLNVALSFFGKSGPLVTTTNAEGILNATRRKRACLGHHRPSSHPQRRGLRRTSFGTRW